MRETPEYNKFILQTSIQTDFCTWSRNLVERWSQLSAFWGKQLIAHFLLKAPRRRVRYLKRRRCAAFENHIRRRRRRRRRRNVPEQTGGRRAGADEQYCCYQSLRGLIFKTIRLKEERRLKQLNWGRRQIQRFNNGNILEKRPENLEQSINVFSRFSVERNTH